MNPIELGKFIAKLRNEKNLTQEELAEKLYIDKRKISRWECGTSIPEFDMLIKLSEILDVSLYELSICKRIENESLSRRLINKFNSAKDFNKYQTRKKIKTIIFIILFIILIITTSYTIKYNDTVEIYKLRSLNEKYYLEGNYIKAKELNFFYIKQLKNVPENSKQQFIILDNCEYEFYDKNKRIVHVDKTNNSGTYYPVIQKRDIDNIAKLEVTCPKDNNKVNTYELNVELVKIYDNKIF